MGLGPSFTNKDTCITCIVSLFRSRNKFFYLNIINFNTLVEKLNKFNFKVKKLS